MDLAYLLVVEQVERVTLAQVTAGADPSLLTERRVALDESLYAEPRTETDPERAALHRALGVG